MTALQTNPYLGRLKLAGDIPASGNPYLDALPEPNPIARGDKPFGIVEAAELAARMAQIIEQGADLDRSPFLDIPIGLARGFATGQEQVGGIAQMLASQGERVTGENFATRFLRNAGRVQAAVGRVGRARFPRDLDEGFVRRTVTDIAEVVPQLIPQIGIALLTSGGSLPMQLVVFAGTGAAPVVGGQYLDSFEHFKQLGFSDEDAANKAAVEAGAAGLITAGTNLVPGFALFRKVPGAEKTLFAVAKRFAARMATAGPAESLQETSEKLITDTFLSVIRDDPTLAKKIFEGDPEYWSGVLREAIAALGAGILGGGTVEIVGLKQTLAKIEQGKTLTPEDLDVAHQALRATLQAEPGRNPADLTFILPSTRDIINQPEIPGDQARPRPEAEVPAEEAPTQADEEVVAVSRVPAAPGEQLAGGLESVRRTTIPPQPTETITEVEELQEQLKEQKKLGQAAVIETRRKGESETRAKLQVMREQAQSKTQTIDALKGQLLRTMNENLPREIPKSVANAVGRARTLGQFAKALRTVREARDQIRRQEAADDLKKTIKKIDPKKLRPQFKQAVERLLANIALTRLSKKTVARLESLATFLGVVDPRVPDNLLPARVIEQVDKLTDVPIADLSAEEAIELNDALNSILLLNQLFNRLTQAQKDRALEQRVAGVASEISLHLKERPEQPSGRISRLAPRGLAGIPFGVEENLMLDTLAELLGGEESLTWKILYRDIANAQKATMAGYYIHMDVLTDIVIAAGLEPGSQELGDFSVELARAQGFVGNLLRALNAEERLDTTATIHDIKLQSGRILRITKGQRMGLLANLMDQETHDFIVFDGVKIHIRGHKAGRNFTFTLQDTSTLRDSATVAELAILEAAMKEVNGPMKQVVREWSVNDKGFDITKPDIWWSRHRIIKGREIEITGARFIESTVESASIVQERTGGTAPIEIRDFFAEYNNLAWATHAVANLGPAIRAAHDVLNSPEVNDLLKNSTRSRALQSFELTFNQLAREAAGGVPIRGFMNRGFRSVASRVGRGILGLNVPVGIKQVVSLTAAMNEMPGSFIMLAASQGAGFDGSIDERMNKNAYLRFRLDGSAIGLMNEGGGTGRAILGFKGRGETVMGLIRIFDRLAVRTIWRAAELQAESEGLTGAEAFDRTSKIAERVVKRTQPTFDTLHISGLAVEAKTQATVKAFLFFRAQRSKHVDMVGRSMIRMSRDPQRRFVEVAKIANIVIVNTVAFRSVTELINWTLRGFQPSDEDDKALVRWAFGLIDVAAGNLIFGGHLAFLLKQMARKAFDLAGIETGRRPIFDPEVSPISSLTEDALQGAAKVIRSVGDDDGAAMAFDGMLDITKSVGPLKGIPLTSPIREAKKLYDQITKDEKRTGGFRP